MQPLPLPTEWFVRLEKVRVDHQDRTALHPLDLEVLRGAVLVIAGANGAGKSTLLEVIAGSRPPTSGHRRATGTAAFVPQRAAISDRLPVTVHDVVSVGTWGGTGRRRTAAQSRASIQTALSRLDITGIARQPFQELSGGQRQRALLGQALARRADLLLLDEPTTGLDSDSADAILGIVREEAERGSAVVCVTHDPAVLGAADRVLRLAAGRVVADSAAPA